MSIMTLFKLNLLSTSFLKPLPNDGNALAASYATEEEVPEAVKNFYAKKGERWELNVTIDGVDGVKSFGDFDRLNRALIKERGDHRTLRDSVKKLNGKSVDELLAELDEIEDLRAQVAAGDPKNSKKVEELVETRLKAKLAPVERERDSFKEKLTKADSQIADFQKNEKRRKIHDAVRAEGVKLKVLPEAIPDALRLSDDIFEIDDSGAILTKDGTDFGVAMTPANWFVELQAKRPHWWPPSSGGGAGGGNGGGNGGKNPWTADGWNKTEQSQIVRDDPARASKLAQQAGVTVSAAHPAAKR